MTTKIKIAKSGFTLIEVLLVISIISLLSSVIIASTNIAKAKARDTSKQMTANQVKNALAMYSTGNTSGRVMPGNYLKDSQYIGDSYHYPDNVGNNKAVEDLSDPESASNLAYERSMRELVDAGVLSEIPHSSDGQSYGYYDYGPGTSAGAMFFVSFEFPQNSAAIASSPCLDGARIYYPGTGGSHTTDLTCEDHFDSCIPGDVLVAVFGSNNLAAGGPVIPTGVHCRTSENVDYYGHTSCVLSYLLDTNFVCSPY